MVGERIRSQIDTRLGNAKALIGDVKKRLDLEPSTPKGILEIIEDAGQRFAEANRRIIAG